MKTAPWYLDWSLWSAAIAFCALAVSLGPHIWRWLRPPKLDLELYERVALTHKVGNPLLQVRVVVRNLGGREVRVTSFEASLRRDNGEPFTLSGLSYLQAQSAPPLLLAPFTLKARDEWGYVTNFFRQLSRDNEREYREAEYALRTNINQKIHQRPPGSTQAITADNQFVAPLVTMYGRNPIRWQAGEYQLVLSVKTTMKRVKAERIYRFTIFESDVEQLRRLTEDYNMGAGIYFDNVERPAWVFPSIAQVDTTRRT
ncbi:MULTISPECIES: hypothetical protein [unclassified Paraburkholderia]|uniref:hypothetical protein n=1 Tax=unclassified Paraburkholderia TaxID=2615204 RepID=UPI00160F6994|nr:MULTISPECIES: hypothetical protein [unclassified Paraburkholderia]MBB5448278.1 hypothetical protein [Paraburkholderia sp. WSM4177]MBB5488659.1 hypothetical protein [Paraburkholderia sp. WSM4180]